MKRKMGLNYLKSKNVILIYFIIVIALIIGNIFPIGYSVKDNKIIKSEFVIENKDSYEAIRSRSYTKNYKIIATGNVQINNICISYYAEDPHFRGNLKAGITAEDGGIIGSSIVNITSTGDEETFAIAALNFDVTTQLLKGQEYNLCLQIDTNMPNYYVKEFDTAGQKDSFCELANEKSIISTITYTPIAIMRYGEIFYGFTLVLILIGGWVTLKEIGVNPFNNRRIKKIICFVQRYYNEVILISMFIFLALYEFYYAYIKQTYISPDSSGYLSEAYAILKGYGLNEYGVLGYNSWFVFWPVGYPLLIAIVSFVLGRNLYLSSKILSILIVGIFLIILYVKFQKEAWIYSFTLLNLGFLDIYKYTWSEIPFILGLLVFCLILDYIVQNNIVKFRWYVFWGISSACLFLCRYFGTFSLFVIGIISLYYVSKFIWKKNNRTQALKKKAAGCAFSAVIATTIMSCYYLINYINTGTISGVERSILRDEYTSLTDNLYDALVKEFFNAFRFTFPDTVFDMSRHFKMGLILVLLITVIFLIYKYRPKDFKLVFLGVGIFYYLVFILVRYHSSMDPFNNRFLAPASILIMIGIMGFCAPFLNKYVNRIAPIVISIMILTILSLSGHIENFDRHNTAYSQLRTRLENDLKAIPINSAILGEAKLDWRIRVFRPDVYYKYWEDATISPNDTMDILFERYNKSDYICIKAKYIKDILFYPIYDYDQSVVDFFDEVAEDTPNEEFLVISVKNRRICNK